MATVAASAAIVAMLAVSAVVAIIVLVVLVAIVAQHLRAMAILPQAQGNLAAQAFITVRQTAVIAILVVAKVKVLVDKLAAQVLAVSVKNAASVTTIAVVAAHRAARQVTALASLLIAPKTMATNGKRVAPQKKLTLNGV